MDRRLAALARGQDGVFTVEQAHRFASTPRQVRRRVDEGDWVHVHPTVLRSTSTPVTFRLRAHAALLAVGGLAALTGRTAAHACGMGWFGEPVGVEVVVHVGREDIGLDGVDIRRRRGLTPAHVVDHAGLAVLERHHLLLDLARALSRSALHALVQDEAFHRRVDVVALNAVRRRGRAGSALLGRVLADYAAKHDTVAEVVGCALLRDAGLHDLEPNSSPHPSLPPADALIREARTAIDIHGSVHELPMKRQSDARKALGYAAHNHLLIVATNEDVFLGGIAWARRVAAVVEQRRSTIRRTG